MKLLTQLYQKIVKEKSQNKDIFFYNTIAKEKQKFTAHKYRKVRMYNCGPTVYGKQHIGNLSSFVFADIIRKVLEYNDFSVKQVINITDVGHLTSDSDDGEDKMSKGLRREGMDLSIENMRALGEKYTNIFIKDLEKLNIQTSKIEFPKASEYIDAQIAMIKTLEEKGYIYKISDGVYFNTSLFPEYGKLGGLNEQNNNDYGRKDLNKEKKSDFDFALWKFDNNLGWESPWGKGFPGWHIECSTMARVLLGEQIDIHTGGIEHIPIHHNNEIAQSEAVGKAPFSRFWIHRAHIQVNNKKISKSYENDVYLSDIIEKGFHPLIFRYWLLTGHYKTPMNFTWEALNGAKNAFVRLYKTVNSLPKDTKNTISKKWQIKFQERINDDLDTPGAIAVMWEMIKDKTIDKGTLKETIKDFDKVLGLSLFDNDLELKDYMKKYENDNISEGDAPEEVKELLKQREEARENKEWDKADKLREEIEKLGFKIKDTKKGYELYYG